MILNNKLSVNTALFLSKFDDYQTEIWLPYGDVTLPVYTNAAEVTSKGFELELIAMPFKNLSLFSSFGYINATYDKFFSPAEGFNYQGNKLEKAPQTEYSISFEYKMPIKNFGTFSISSDFIHKDDTYFNASNTDDYLIEGRDLLNGKIGYESQNSSFGIFIWGRNLFDKLYMLAKGVTPSTIGYVWYGSPRTFGIQLSYNFL